LSRLRSEIWFRSTERRTVKREMDGSSVRFFPEQSARRVKDTFPWTVSWTTG
jgi:hypothetical protein